jgi:6,7-dimethyl-8-ribityllumazine synthase
MLTEPSGGHLPPPESMAGRRFALLVARFNSEITEVLRDRCIEGLRECGVLERDIDVFHVPGSWELPQVASRLGHLHRHDCLIALGCVIRGETSHFDFVAGEASDGLSSVARAVNLPIIFGVLTPDTVEQAWDRAHAERADKGREFALSAAHMVTLYEGLR